MFKPVLSTWKQLAGLAVGLVWLLLPTAALAAGERYHWKDDSRQVIVATEGVYQLPTEFGPPVDDGTNVTFAAPGVSYKCASQDYEPNFKLVISKANYDLKTATTPAALQLSQAPESCQETFKPDQQTQVLADAQATAQEEAEDQCDEGALSWVMCPILTKLQESIASIATAMLEPVLKVAPLQASQDSGLYKTWSAMRNIANVGFVIIFFVVIFANTLSLKLDYYTIKRIIPRFILAAILVQFSFLLSGLIVDLGNITGAGVKVLFEALNTTATPRDSGNIIENLGLLAAVGGVLFKVAWPMALPILAVLALTILTFYLVMSIRLILIAVLVVVSPLAMVAWTLPNTERLFKNWFEYLMRLTLMYPMIMAILAAAGMVNELLAFTGETANNGGAGLVVDLMRPLIFIGTFLLIPATFLWAGKIMTAVGAAGIITAVSAYKGSLKDRQFHKDAEHKRTIKQLETMNKVEERTRRLSQRHTPIGQFFGRSAQAAIRTGAGFYFGAAPATPLAKARAFAGVFSAFDKELESLPDTQVPYLKEALNLAYSPDASKREAARTVLRAGAPSILKYTDSFAGRTALIKRTDNFNMMRDSDLQNIKATRPQEYAMAIKVSSNLQKNIPAASMRYGLHEVNEQGVEMPIGTLKADVLKAILGGLQAGKLSGDFHQENFDIAAQDAVVAQVFAKYASPITFSKVFDSDIQVFADPSKRKSILKMIAKQRSLFQSGNGKDLHDAILKVLGTNNKQGRMNGYDIFDDILRDVLGVPDYIITTLDDQDKLDHIKRYL